MALAWTPICLRLSELEPSLDAIGPAGAAWTGLSVRSRRTPTPGPRLAGTTILLDARGRATHVIAKPIDDPLRMRREQAYIAGPLGARATGCAPRPAPPGSRGPMPRGGSASFEARAKEQGP